MLDDSKGAIAFVTERIICSLADILSRFNGIAQGVSVCEGYLEPNGSLSEIELGRGLLNLAEGLQYIHTVGKKLHMSISPENVVITSSGQWKLCGFGLSLSFLSPDQPMSASPYFLKASMNVGGIRLEPDLSFASPEVSEGGSNNATVRNLTSNSDVFSLGLLAYEVYRFNLKVITAGRMYVPTVLVANNSPDYHITAIAELRSLDYSFLPPPVTGLLMNMMQFDARYRMAINDVVNNQFFATGPLAVLKTVDSLLVRDVGTQCSQVVSLANQLYTFSPRILENTILPTVLRCCEANPMVWTHVFPVLEFIRGKLTPTAFQLAFTAAAVQGLSITGPVDAMQTIMKNFEFFLSNFDPQFFSVLFFLLPYIKLSSQPFLCCFLCFRPISLGS